jgi:hypothetical protein
VAFQKLYMRLFHAEGEKRGQFLPITKLERDTKVAKAVRIRGLQPFWESREIVLAEDLPALADFLEEAERFRPWKESLHDDMLDALADCLQLRVRPEPVDPNEGLDEVEAELRAFADAHPRLDRMSLRNAWTMKKRHEAWEEAREVQVMGGGPLDEFFAGG